MPRCLPSSRSAAHAPHRAGFTPYAWAIWASDYPIATKNPKVVALVDRVLGFPAVVEYLSSEACMLKSNAFGADGLSAVWP